MEQKENIFKVLQLLHRAMLAGMILFSIIGVYISVTGQIKHVETATGKVLQVAVIVIAFLFAGVGFYLFNKRVQATDNLTTAMERMAVYRSAAILRWAMIEVPVMFAIISFVLTGNYAFLAFAVVLMFLFLYVAPTKNKIVQQLQISEKESRQLEGRSE